MSPTVSQIKFCFIAFANGRANDAVNITNAAILYDETFVVDHKYKALLQNIPTRHVITAIANDRERTEQITKLRNLDINNYFILGTLDSIKKVLGEKKARICMRAQVFSYLLPQ